MGTVPDGGPSRRFAAPDPPPRAKQQPAPRARGSLRGRLALMLCEGNPFKGGARLE